MILQMYRNATSGLCKNNVNKFPLRIVSTKENKRSYLSRAYHASAVVHKHDHHGERVEEELVRATEIMHIDCVQSFLSKTHW